MTKNVPSPTFDLLAFAYEMKSDKNVHNSKPWVTSLIVIIFKKLISLSLILSTSTYFCVSSYLTEFTYEVKAESFSTTLFSLEVSWDG